MTIRQADFPARTELLCLFRDVATGNLWHFPFLVNTNGQGFIETDAGVVQAMTRMTVNIRGVPTALEYVEKRHRSAIEEVPPTPAPAPEPERPRGPRTLAEARAQVTARAAASLSEQRRAGLAQQEVVSLPSRITSMAEAARRQRNELFGRKRPPVGSIDSPEQQ